MLLLSLLLMLPLLLFLSGRAFSKSFLLLILSRPLQRQIEHLFLPKLLPRQLAPSPPLIPPSSCDGVLINLLLS